MIVHLHRQLMAALETAALQYFATILGSHAGPKTVNAQAAMDFWLISPLRHPTSFLKTNVLMTVDNYTLMLPGGQLPDKCVKVGYFQSVFDISFANEYNEFCRSLIWDYIGETGFWLRCQPRVK
jgi:hypothetical protein